MLQIPKAILNSIEALQLQSPPQILLRFLHLVEDDRTTIPELATLVGQDPSLSARVLTVANSPALHRGTVSKSVTRCLVNLGTRLARTLAGCLVVQNVFSPAVNNRKYSFSGFWGHSLLVAELAREISVAVAYTDVEEAYLAGILHDIGQLLLLGGMEDSYGRLLESSGDETDLLNAETISLGTTHCAVGTWLVDKWELSSFMADSILFHHKTAEEIVCADRLSQIIWAAHVLSEQIKFLDPKQRTQLLDLEAVIALLGVDVSTLIAIHERCIERVTVIAEALGISNFSTVKTLPCLLPQPCEPGRFGGRENDQAHTSLEEAVRDMAMMQPLQQDLASLESEEELLLGIREFAQILFGPGRFAFLLLRSDKPVLSGATLSGQPEILQQIEIPLIAGQSLAADVAIARQLRSTFELGSSGVITLVDTQIVRALGGEGVVYLPLYDRLKNIGVMAFGISSANYCRLSQHFPWMTSYAKLAAHAIETWRDMQDRIHSVEADLTKSFEQKARRVFHEAGNPLGIINNYLSIIRKKLPDGSNLDEELDILKEEIDRVTKIVRQINAPPETTVVVSTLDINSLIENMLVLYGKTLFFNRDITVEKALDPLLGPISCSRDNLKQILVNLWNNAADAMSAGGAFALSTHADVNQDGSAFVEIRMTDNGPGLPPDVMQRLFQPLEPDRRPGHSGIGLSIVAGLVEQLGGRITCRSTVGEGTSFSILLPKPAENKACTE